MWSMFVFVLFIYNVHQAYDSLKHNNDHLQSLIEYNTPKQSYQEVQLSYMSLRSSSKIQIYFMKENLHMISATGICNPISIQLDKRDSSKRN